MQIVTKPKKWGNSLGLVIPKEIIRQEHIQEDSTLIVDIKRETPVKEIFGILKGKKIDTQKFKDQMRNKESISEKRNLVILTV